MPAHPVSDDAEEYFLALVEEGESPALAATASDISRATAYRILARARAEARRRFEAKEAEPAKESTPAPEPDQEVGPDETQQPPPYEPTPAVFMTSDEAARSHAESWIGAASYLKVPPDRRSRGRQRILDRLWTYGYGAGYLR
jgi:hypothetical protein